MTLVGAIVACMIGAVVICAGSLVMTLINLGYYCNARGGARGRAPAPRGGPSGVENTPLVSVCIPARDEEANIEACVLAVLSSDWPALEVLVYDDQSTDATPRIIERLIEQDPRVRRAPTSALPPVWVGKQWACQQLGRAARGEWLVFTDADVRFEPTCVRAALDAARALDADLISTFPRQITATLAERLLVPMIHFILFSYLPMGQMRGSNSPSASAGCGQFLCVRRGAYESAGGHAAWRDSMHDGIRMPRAVRRAGFHSDLFDGTRHLSCRMYRGFVQTWRGFAKNAYEGLGSVGLLLFLTVLHVVGHVLPWIVLPGAVLVESWRGPILLLAAAAVVLALAQRLVLARRFEQDLIGAALHPLAVLMMTAVQWHSFALARLGRRAWKGRASGSAAPPAAPREGVQR